MGRYSRIIYFVLVSGFAAAAADYTILDVQKVPLSGDPLRAVVHISAPANPQEISCDVLVAGAGMGGIGAALTLANLGHSVCLTEETDWVGGQATAGGVPALDENRFIELSGGTRMYMQFREGIRDWYRHNRTLTAEAKAWENLNPGTCYVSPLCFEPKAAVNVLEAMLKSRPKIELFLRTAVFHIERHSATIESALAWQFDKREAVRIRARFYLDATEMGDLLPLAKVPYVVGSEAKADTGEPDALSEANPACVQSFTYPFVIEHAAQGQAGPKPLDYDAILKRQGFSLTANYPQEFGWRGPFTYHMFGDDPPVPNNMSPGPFFSWRRLLDKRNFAAGVPNDIALMNWPRQDYAAESPFDKTPQEMARIFQRAKQTSQAFLYWLWTAVPRDEGGHGYPELKLRADAVGTADGMSKYPYIRESRRLVAQQRVTEQDIVEEYQIGARARWFPDSVGTGFYMVDIHPCGANEHGRMRMPKPFQIPLGTLMPKEPLNLLAAGKTLGVTHLTNGAFRLHPVEWNVGEAAGTLAAMWIEQGRQPRTEAVQTELAKAGVQMVWFDDLGPDHPAFAAIQLAALGGMYPLSLENLHATPDAPVTRTEAAQALLAYELGIFRPDARTAVAHVLREGWMATDHRNWFHGDLPFYWTDWREGKLIKALPPMAIHRTGPVKRSELAQRLSNL